MALPIAKRKPRRKPRAKINTINKLSARVRKIESEKQLKYAEYDMTAIDFSYDAPYILTLNNPSQGTEDVERIGDKITNVHIKFTYTILKNGSTANIARIMIIYDKQNTITAITDVLSSGVSIAPLADYNFDKRKEFNVIMDKFYPLDTYHAIHDGQLNMKLNYLTKFNAASTTINTGAIKLLVLSNVADTTTNAQFWAVCRISFYD